MDPLLPPPPFPSLPTATLTPPVSAGDSSPVPAAAAPPQNHAANATTTPPLPQTYNHPPYAEMIYAAITALKERDGSSKRAISKYIEKVYSGLPPTHPTLLTHHLKRLKNSGLLVMNKKSYMLPPRSDVLPGSNPPPTPPVTTNGSYAASAVTYSQAPPQQQQQMLFPPGMPQPFFPNPFQQQFPGFPQAPGQLPGQAPTPLAGPGQVSEGSAGSAGVRRGRGRPPKPKNVVHPGGDAQATQQPGLDAEPNGSAQPVFVALGLADDPTKVAKRRPGRPKKLVSVEPGAGPVSAGPQQQVVKRGRGRPPRSGAGKLGRPRKPKSLAAGGVKRGPGRPPKNPNQGQLTLVNVPFTVDPALLNVPKPRGRPRKVAVPGVGGVMPMKRMGRPPKAIAGLNRRKSTGRPVGRPRKNPLALPGEAHRSGPQSEGYEDMKRQLEFFQSRIMRAVGVLKPEFNSESSAEAIAAIQELEGLASMDITAPFREDPQPQPQPAPAAAAAAAAAAALQS